MLPLNNKVFFTLGVILIIAVIFVDLRLGRNNVVPSSDNGVLPPEGDVTPENSTPRKQGSFRLGYRFSGNSMVYEFNPDQVKTTRPDIFKPGFFSVFDVLIHVANRGEIELEYHFDEKLNTFVIDSMNGAKYWWYEIYYSGGWSESNYFRMDHYPWKDDSTLTFFEVSAFRIEKTYEVYLEEYQRLKENDGNIVVPKVIIDGQTFQKEFTDVKVSAHNLRNDTFKNGVITAIDVILSLGDQGKLSYTLEWYESIGTANIVKNYWVESIEEDISRGRCGFVYESGDLDLRGFVGNHIHLPSDSRILNSPEYVLYFWICI
jgi:hypothetical protein